MAQSFRFIEKGIKKQLKVQKFEGQQQEIKITCQYLN
jgi:hypothetical protein